MSRVRLATVVAGLLCGAVTLAGCGIPTEATSTPISPSRVPYHLLSPQPPATTTTTSPAYTTSITVYFTVTFSRYVAPVTVQVQKPTLTVVLEVLLGGPSPVLASKNYQSAFAPSVQLVHASVAGSVATVDFNRPFGQLSGTSALLAVAQVVFTVTTNFTNVKALKFQIDNVTTAVPTPATGLTLAPVGPDLYKTLLQPQSAASTTTTATPG